MYVLISDVELIYSLLYIKYQLFIFQLFISLSSKHIHNHSRIYILRSFVTAAGCDNVCDDHLTCYASYQECDFVPDCPNGEDEPTTCRK